MTRVKRGVAARKKHKKIIALAKGYKHGRKNVFRLAKQAVIKAKAYSYRDRKVKKRTFRSLWIVRINAGLKPHDIKYRDFIYGLRKAGLSFNRKILAQLATDHTKEFENIVSQTKEALAKKS